MTIYESVKEDLPNERDMYVGRPWIRPQCDLEGGSEEPASEDWAW